MGFLFRFCPQNGRGKRIVLGLVVSVGFVFPQVVKAAPPAKTPVQIVATSDKALIFDFYLKQFKDDTVRIGGEVYHRFLFSGSQTDARSGQPELPFLSVPVGVPPGAHLSARVLSAEFRTLTGVTVIPVPEWKKHLNLLEPIYQVPPNYFTSETFLPKRTVEARVLGKMADLAVGQIRVFPIQFNAAERRVKIFTHLRVEIRFLGGKSLPPRMPVLSVRERAFYEGAVLNFTQAQKWISKRPVRSLARMRSVSRSGTWYKFPVMEEGVYKITGKFLKDNGVNIAEIDPKTLKIYNNGGKALPRGLDVPRPDSLIENAIYLVDGNDGHFDESDYLLFFGRSVTGWDYHPGTSHLWRHYINPYTDKNVYWLVFNDNRPGRRMASIAAAPNTRDPELTQVPTHYFWEQELMNPLHSGMVWFGMSFLGQEEKSLTLVLPGLVSSKPVSGQVQMASFSSGGKHIVDFYMNGSFVATKTFYSGQLRDLPLKNIPGAKSGENKLTIQYTGKTQVSQAYLDWIELTYTRSLNLNGGQLFFWAPVRGQAQSYRFSISNVSAGAPVVWDITDFSDVKVLSGGVLSGGTLTFSARVPADTPERFAVVQPSAFKTPGALLKDEPSNLRNPQNGADLVVITHTDFYNVAMGLKNFRETHDGLSVAVAKVTDVYDEFSGGLFDPTAIRDFLKYTYFHWAKRPSYVLLLGDGTYDYKGIVSHMNGNWIPTYQDSSLYESDTRTTDDWFTCVNGRDWLPEFSIGRIPVQSTEQAQNVLDKIVSYESNPNYGAWRNTITIVADDEFGNVDSYNETTHTIDAEDIAEHYYPRLFDRKKIYLMNYPMVLDAAASGRRKPAAEEDFVEQINRGSLIINYLGHGNEHLLAHERVLEVSKDLPRIQNAGRLAFWIAATCTFGRYDLPEEQSMTEQLLDEADNGAIALLVSARDVYANQNAAFNKKYITKLFLSPHRTRRVGDALRLTKIATGNGINDEKFWLCGDPTLALAVPKLKVQLKKIYPDSLKALSKILVTGAVQTDQNETTDFSGKVYLQAFDSERPTSYTTAFHSTVHYLMPGRPIFRGVGAVSNGHFSLQFLVPKDISYGGNLGRISAYVWNDRTDGSGYRDHLIVDGTARGFVDSQGPQIDVGFKGQSFVDGDLLGPHPVMEVFLKDTQSGINIAGDIGHKITVLFDDKAATKRDMTDYFNYDEGSYLSGKIEFPLPEMPEGRHTATIKAWDNANNSSKRTISFVLASQTELAVENLLPYPNPFSVSTDFSFEINHPAEIKIKIFTLSGRLIARLPVQTAEVGYNTIFWNGLDQDGDAIGNGVYLFQFTARADDRTTTKIGKLIKIR